MAIKNSNCNKYKAKSTTRPYAPTGAMRIDDDDDDKSTTLCIWNAYFSFLCQPYFHVSIMKAKVSYFFFFFEFFVSFLYMIIILYKNEQRTFKKNKIFFWV